MILSNFSDLFQVDESLEVVFTLGANPYFEISEKFGLVEINGCCPAVVHQYDRSDELKRLILSRFEN
jgi:hypothetical protein